MEQDYNETLKKVEEKVGNIKLMFSITPSKGIAVLKLVLLSYEHPENFEDYIKNLQKVLDNNSVKIKNLIADLSFIKEHIRVPGVTVLLEKKLIQTSKEIEDRVKLYKSMFY